MPLDYTSFCFGVDFSVEGKTKRIVSLKPTANTKSMKMQIYWPLAA